MTTIAGIDVAAANARRLGRRVRNNRLFDIWSLAHVAWGLGLGIFLGPWWAFGILVAWEPFEILLLGPWLARWGIPFGHETWRNSLSDVVFDGLGAGLAFVAVLPAWNPFNVL